ncbi:hypothetical protein CMV_000604 [Castanea mollissima]|uniref:Pentatricopeptide repeat-containing protein n=1 Tax=Castanea mollissima TaxID=60419 RepID=A0A8J4RSY4_9ROSI|nr:hypothetical protein CMV_000604 [Castanea mollissima]
MIDTMSKSRNVEKAKEVFNTMKKRRFVPDIKSYTIMLEGWGQEQNLLRLNVVYREMRDEGFELDVVTYDIIIIAHCKERKYEALELFREMEAKNFKPTPQSIKTVLIRSLTSDSLSTLKRSNFPPKFKTSL